jgi:Ca2+-binding RTX toxin-like protein
VPADRLDFLNSTGAWANDAGLPKDVDGVTTTGLGSIDFWIGGLAEKQMPFGGLLGSTFNYVFENQMEKLQNGDRFYYLERTAGLNFLTELENNSFAKLIMANTDTTHLPGDVFSTPAFTLEVDQSKQFTGIAAPQPAIGESGTVAVTQLTGDIWHTVTFTQPIADAVVIMMVNSTTEADAAPVRVRNVTLSGFEFQIDEWEVNDDTRDLPETLSWFAMSAGEHVLPDGTVIKAGYRSVDNTVAHVDFDTDFAGTPVVLTQVSSAVDTTTVTTRLTNVGTGGFDVRLQEQERNEAISPAHALEQVGWIAIAQGVGTTLAAGAGNLIDENTATINYGATFTNPVFLAQMQTTNDADTATVRGVSVGQTSADVFVQEDTSAAPLDPTPLETDHGVEDVGFVALGTGVIFGSNPVLNGDPTGDNPLIPLVIRNNPATIGADANYLRYTGEDHVVLGGTAFDDIIISSIGDDTLYGDGGNDRLEGGDGVDIIFGGTGDDIITDKGGDDNLQGQDGNDAIHGGNGVNLILGGFGNDFIVTGEDSNEAFGGPGNDFILGTRADEMQFGNEGDDWLEHGLADGSAGENFDTRGLDAIVGNDVFIGDTVADRMLGEGGDDIMVGNGGQVDRYIGSSGFDWASFKHDTLAANADLNLRAFDETRVPLSVASTLARFESTEGLSGSKFSDILRGDDADAAAIAASGFTGSILTNFGLIAGLREFVAEAGDGADLEADTADDQFGAGNIILGGDGSDIIEGRGGDDLIDGDLMLNVRISWRTDVNDPDTEIESFNSMAEMQARVFSGEINPGQLVIVREILPGTPAAFNFDTAQYSGNLADYTIAIDDGGTPLDFSDDIVTVTHVDAAALNGIGIDGVDRLTHIERLQFNDQALVLVPNLNSEPAGTLAILDADTALPVSAPLAGQLLRVSIADVTDADNVSPTNPDGLITGPVTYVWQFEARPGTGLFEDIVLATGLGDLRATGETFRVPPDLDGLALRVRAIYQDANGVLEQVFSDVTDPVAGGGVGNAPVVAPALTTFSGATGATEDQVFLGTLAGLATDPNGDAVTFSIVDDPDPLAGDVVLNPDGTFVFTPNADFFGTASFTFVASDGVLDSNVGTVEIVVANVDDAPEVGDPAILGPLVQDRQLTITAAQLLANVTDIDSLVPDDIQILNLIASSGVLVDNLDRTWTFTPDAGDQTLVTFTYDVSSDGVTLVAHEATLDLLPNQQPGDPTLGANTVAEFAANGTLVGNLSAFDAEGDPLTFSLLDGAGGRFALVGNQIQVANGILLDFEQAASHNIVIQVDDGISAPVIQAFTINVTDVNPEILTGTADGDTIFGGAGADRFNGAGGDDVLRGNAGADRIAGGAGNDRIVATIGDGNDRYDGGAGLDTLDLSLTTAGTTLDLVEDTATSAQIGTERIISIENAIGSQGNDDITGGNGANFLDGQGGNDRLIGNGGADTILGGGGNDTINAGAGSDVVDGGAGDDIINTGTGNDRIILAAGFGNDSINQFDANPTGGQDLLDVSALGINSGNFVDRVTITDLGANTEVLIEDGLGLVTGKITLFGVNGTGANSITIQDFLLS